MQFIIIRDNHNSHIFLILFFYHIDKSSSDCFSMVIRVNKKIMYIGIHYSVIHNTYHPNELTPIPSGINSVKVFHCNCKLIWKMPR